MTEEKEKQEKEEELAALRKALPEYEIEPYTDWSPGDPIKNSGDLLLNMEYEEKAAEKGDLIFGEQTIVCYDGSVKELGFTAPELIDTEATKKYHKEYHERPLTEGQKIDIEINEMLNDILGKEKENE